MFFSFSFLKNRPLSQNLDLDFQKNSKNSSQIPTKAQAMALSAELESRAALPPQVAAAVDALPPGSTHPMTQLAVGTLAMQSGSKFAKAYADGLHKSRYWEPVLEDSLDLIARLPALAARIYRRTYHGGKFIEAKVSFFFSFVYLCLLFFFFDISFFSDLSLSSPLSLPLPPPSPSTSKPTSRASTGRPTCPT